MLLQVRLQVHYTVALQAGGSEQEDFIMCHFYTALTPTNLYENESEDLCKISGCFLACEIMVCHCARIKVSSCPALTAPSWLQQIQQLLANPRSLGIIWYCLGSTTPSYGLTGNECNVNCYQRIHLQEYKLQTHHRRVESDWWYDERHRTISIISILEDIKCFSVSFKFDLFSRIVDISPKWAVWKLPIWLLSPLVLELSTIWGQ